MNIQKGFTLIELIIVIVILGILAAVAIPSYIDIRAEARQAATDGVAGSLGAASAINKGIRSAFPTKGVPVNNCTSVANALDGGLPSGYTITAAAIAAGATATCTVTRDTGGETATFTGHGIA